MENRSWTGRGNALVLEDAQKNFVAKFANVFCSEEPVIRCIAKIVALIKYCNLTLLVQSQCHTIISCELEVSAVIGFSWISMAHPLHRVESGRNKSARALATTAIRPFSSHARKTRLWPKGWIKGHVVKLCSLRKLPQHHRLQQLQCFRQLLYSKNPYVWDGKPWTDTPSCVKQHSYVQ